MITREQLFPMLFYEKAKFNGSKGKMNYRIEKDVEEDASEKRFKLTIWEGPECYDATTKEKTETFYEYSDSGMLEIMDVLNNMK